MASVPKRLGGFALAGFSGFLVDAGLTEALAGFGVSPYLGRVFAVAIAIAVTYTINRNLTLERAARTGSGPPDALRRSIARLHRRELPDLRRGPHRHTPDFAQSSPWQPARASAWY